MSMAPFMVFSDVLIDMSSPAAVFWTVSVFDCGAPDSLPFRSIAANELLVCARRMNTALGARIRTDPLTLSRDLTARTSKAEGVTSVRVKDAGCAEVPGTNAWPG